MASTHKSLRSGTANKRPTTSIADGQIALNTNTTSPGLFFKDSTGATIIKVGPVHVGTTAPNASPAAGGSAGNSVGEIWLDTSLTPVGVKIWNGSAFVNATPIGSTTVQGLLELATNAETQTGTDPDRAVTPAGLQSKVSDSTSTTSSTTIASSTAVKSAYDLANAALPKSGGTVTGNLEIGTTGSLSFEGATADAFETTIAVVDPTADRTITLPDTTGTVVTTGDTGTVTSTMIADGTIVNGDINASAAINHSKLANITAGSVLLGNASNVPTATALSGDVTVNSTGVTAISSGVIVNADVNASAAIAGTKISPDFGSQTITTTGVVSAALGAAATPSLTFTGDLNTGIYSPGADQVAISTGGSGRLFVDASGRVGVGVSSPQSLFHVDGDATAIRVTRGSAIGFAYNTGTAATDSFRIQSNGGSVDLLSAASQPITLSAGGSEKVRITSAGLVGVGTSAPSSILNVVAQSDTAGGDGITLGNYTGNRKWLTRFGTNTDLGLYQDFWDGATWSTKLALTYTGRLGIGSSVPDQRLVVAGNITVGDNSSSGYSHLYFISGTSGSTRYGRISKNYDSPFDLRITASNSASAAPICFDSYSGNEIARFDTSGRLGIGTQSPAYQLTTSGDILIGKNGGFLAFNSNPASSSTPVYISGDVTNSALVFAAGSSEKARLTSSGQWLVGTSSSTTVGSSASALIQIRHSGSNGQNGLSIVDNETGAGTLILGRNNSGTTVPNNGLVGRITFAAHDGTNLQPQIATIDSLRDGAASSGSVAGRLVFSTTADGASSPTERMRIGQNGSVSIGGNAGTNDWRLFVVSQAANSSSYGAVFRNSVGTELLLLRSDGIIHTGNSASSPYNNTVASAANAHIGADYVLYRSTSSIRFKKDVEDLEDQYADAILGCRPVWFRSTASGDSAHPDWGYWGFIAEEVAKIDPRLVFWKTHETAQDANGNQTTVELEEPVVEGVQYDRFVPHLINLIKRQKEQIEAMEARLSALESA